MTQEMVVGIIVLGAVVYLARMVWNQTRGKSSCGCGKSGGCAGETPTSKSATSSTRSGATNDIKLPAHLIQIQARTPRRDHVDLN